jgi:hypothetical protein
LFPLFLLPPLPPLLVLWLRLIHFCYLWTYNCKEFKTDSSWLTKRKLENLQVNF